MYKFVPLIPNFVKSSHKTTALQTAPITIHGLYLPNFVRVLSTIVPIIGSLIPSQILAIGVNKSKKPSFNPKTLDK